MPPKAREDMQDAKPFPLRLPKTIREQLEGLAAKDARSLNSYIERVLTKHVEEQMSVRGLLERQLKPRTPRRNLPTRARGMDD